MTAKILPEDPPALEAGAAERFAEVGFMITPTLLDATAIAQLRSALQRAVDEDLAAWSDNPWYGDHWMVHNLMLRDPRFLQLMDHPGLHAHLDALFTPHGIVYAYTSSSLPPRGSNYSRRIHVDAQAQTTELVTNVGVLWALDDFSDENGATLFLPGSHRSLSPPDDTTFFRDAVKAYPRAGQAVIFNARVFHYGGENTTDRARHAVTFNVCRPWMKQRFDYPRMLSAEQQAMLGPRGRRFAGFDARVPVSLDEYYVPPADRLFKSGQH